MTKKTTPAQELKEKTETKRRSITEITEEIHGFLKTAEEQGFDEQTIADTIEGMSYDLDDKLAAYRLVMDRLELEAETADAQAKALRAQAKGYADRAKTLKEKRSNMTYPLLNLFKKLGETKKSGSYGTFFIKKGADKLHVDEGKLPQDYMERVVAFKNDEARIKKELSEGKELEFAWYETGAESVQLRK